MQLQSGTGELVFKNLHVRPLTEGAQLIWDDPGTSIAEIPIAEGGLAMAPRLALLSLILAFGVSVAFATVTTVRQVHLESASPVHAVRS
ncbi:hypothetical protein XF30_28525 [Bradyrhizobium sp. SUTN9-2]|nr:hypothetical protein XF30_28525 [Bradyrhizobium sp. SUTN9-2]